MYVYDRQVSSLVRVCFVVYMETRVEIIENIFLSINLYSLDMLVPFYGGEFDRISLHSVLLLSNRLIIRAWKMNSNVRYRRMGEGRRWNREIVTEWPIISFPLLHKLDDNYRRKSCKRDL